MSLFRKKDNGKATDVVEVPEIEVKGDKATIESPTGEKKDVKLSDSKWS